jgi:hypothetical protein
MIRNFIVQKYFYFFHQMFNSMNKFKSFQSVMFVALLGLFGTACSNDDPEPENEQEEINSMVVTFTPAGGGAPVVFSFLDADGPGGMAPTITAPALRANTTYTASVVVAEVEPGKTEDKTPEIRSEDDEHQFFFIFNPAGLATHTYQDTDRNNRPLGLANRVVTAAANTGTLRVVLRHDLNKAFAGLNSANYLQAGGETDIEVTFNVTVQ